MSFVGGGEIGQVFVQTTEHRGHTPEEIAERAVNKVLRAQNEVELKQVLIKYLQEAQNSERMNARRKLIDNGFSDAASRLGD
jgi:hypothetical protein